LLYRFKTNVLAVKLADIVLEMSWRVGILRKGEREKRGCDLRCD